MSAPESNRNNVLPNAPVFSDEDLRQFRESNDFTPALFEWYKFVGSLAAVVSHIQKQSPAFQEMPDRHFHILIGLLNRCTRLMLSNVALSHEGRFGETTAIVDRCIFESAVKVAWLCNDPSEEKFIRYQADGLKSELELKGQIESNIAARNGNALPIEQRMLKSIQRSVDAAGLTLDEVATSKKLPDMAAILSAVGFDRLVYTVGQRIGSHHVHGTWVSLLTHYLEEENEGSLIFVPRGHDCRTHINQFLSVSMMVLYALDHYVRYAVDADSSQSQHLSAASLKQIQGLFNPPQQQNQCPWLPSQQQQSQAMPPLQ